MCMLNQHISLEFTVGPLGAGPRVHAQCAKAFQLRWCTHIQLTCPVCHGVPILGRWMNGNLITELPADTFAKNVKLTKL